MIPARLLVTAIVSAALAACGSGAGGGERATEARGARRYTVRAEVVELPEPRAALRQLELRHEAIDDFRDASGAVVGMDAMVMPFALAPEVSLDGVRPGDVVEVVLSVDWARPSLRIERLRELPEGTALTFGKARPKAGAP